MLTRTEQIQILVQLGIQPDINQRTPVTGQEWKAATKPPAKKEEKER